eukprot:COSAG04_NODE_822_length_10053_cov_12.017681_10_plen_64_part_00
MSTGPLAHPMACLPLLCQALKRLPLLASLLSVLRSDPSEEAAPAAPTLRGQPARGCAHHLLPD